MRSRGPAGRRPCARPGPRRLRRGFAATELDPIPEIPPAPRTHRFGCWGWAPSPSGTRRSGTPRCASAAAGARSSSPAAGSPSPPTTPRRSSCRGGVAGGGGEGYFGVDEIGTLPSRAGWTPAPPEYEPRVADMPDPWGAIRPPGHPGRPFRPSLIDGPDRRRRPCGPRPNRNLGGPYGWAGSWSPEVWCSCSGRGRSAANRSRRPSSSAGDQAPSRGRSTRKLVRPGSEVTRMSPWCFFTMIR